MKKNEAVETSRDTLVNEKSLESSFEEISDIISRLEQDDISLEDSFKLYQEGIKLLQHCNNSIDKVEKQLIILGEKNESDEL
ncbi:MAG: Exonuclease small subunit [Anaerocolumna sp.]|jgi:exodeoxyribonuclease VII small subunit|nr:Exonuclease small subunit [Anaerocolumna sp.]